MTEETHNAAAQRPARHRDVHRGLAVRRAGPADRDHLRDPELRSRGRPRRPACRRSRSSSTRSGATAAKLLLLIAIGAQLFCGMSSVTANSRMIYAFSRDGALPGSSFWHRVNKRTRTPTNAIWLAAGFAFILGLPYLWNCAAYGAVTSIAVIGLYIAYVMPDVPAAAPGRQLPARPLAPGPVEQADRDHRGDLGRDHHDPVHAAAAQPDHRGRLQLHAGGRGGRARLRRHLLAGLGPQVVHRAAGPGHRRGTGRHRARAVER